MNKHTVRYDAEDGFLVVHDHGRGDVTVVPMKVRTVKRLVKELVDGLPALVARENRKREVW